MTGPVREFEEMYTKTYARLVAQLTVISGSPQEAQDAVQEAMCRAWLRWKTVGTYSDPEGWIRRVALNQSISQWRRLKRLLPLSESSDLPGPVADNSFGSTLLVESLAQLPKRQRTALVLHYVAELPIEQVAREMGVRPGTVKSMLSRGRQRLTVLLSSMDVDSVSEKSESSKLTFRMCGDPFTSPTLLHARLCGLRSGRALRPTP
jgi:RNA polymerase sigma-70 factor (ECF subfamily)